MDIDVARIWRGRLLGSRVVSFLMNKLRGVWSVQGLVYSPVQIPANLHQPTADQIKCSLLSSVAKGQSYISSPAVRGVNLWPRGIACKQGPWLIIELFSLGSQWASGFYQGTASGTQKANSSDWVYIGCESPNSSYFHIYCSCRVYSVLVNLSHTLVVPDLHQKILHLIYMS